jgi:hypothetical protein
VQSLERREQILLTVRTGIGWFPALRQGREGAYQPQGPLVAIKDLLEILAARTAALDRTDPVRFGIKPRMTRAAASPFDRSDLQHASKIISNGAEILDSVTLCSVIESRSTLLGSASCIGIIMLERYGRKPE